MIFLLEESRGSRRSPADPRSESRLSIPQRGALQRSSSLLPQPSSILKRTVEIVENYSVNGKCLILRLSQLGGASQSMSTRRCWRWSFVTSTSKVNTRLSGESSVATLNSCGRWPHGFSSKRLKRLSWNQLRNIGNQCGRRSSGIGSPCAISEKVRGSNPELCT